MNFDSLNLNWADFSGSNLNQFHFIRPEWLWVLVILLLLWLLIGRLGRSTHWESFIAKDKLEALRVTGGRYSQTWRWLLILGWVIGTFAAAGPAWKQVPVPTVRDESAMVIILDFSRSMLAQDMAPDRLTRTKYKLIDILRMRGDGQTALIAYAGDPHTVSPLTDDPRTIEALLPALHPNVMPVQGSNTEAAIDLSIQLLKDAGLSHGEVLLLTDGVAPDAQKYIRDRFDGSFRLSILGIGSTDAVPIPRDNGGFFTDSRGEIILTKLNRDELQILAGLSGGRYVELQPDESDIKYLLKDNFEISDNSEDHENALLYDSWEDMGYWLVLLILPFVAYSFRKGAIYVLPLIFLLPNDSQALSTSEIWNDLWLTKDQQGAKLMQGENASEAADTFKRQDWAGVADFNAQNYQSAAERFAAAPSDIENVYNRGNALAFNGDLEGAIAAYDQVLEQQPNHEDAAHNKAVIEQLLQQQEQQQQQDSPESDERSDENSDESQDQEGENQENQNDQGQQGENSEQDSQQSSEQQESENQDEQSSDSDQQAQQSEQENQDSEQTQNSEQQQVGEESVDEEETKSEQSSGQEERQESQEQSEEQRQAAMTPAEATPDALEDTSEQWLRAIPDDPSGLLRRKFDYQTRQNKLERRYQLQVPKNPDDERY